MDENKKENKFIKNPKYFTITVYAVVGFLICALIVRVVFSFTPVWNAVKVVFGVLAPFAIGIILAYLINPLFKFLDFTFFGKWLHMKKRRRLRKTLSLLISYIIVIGLIAALIYVIVPQFVTSIRSLIGTITAFTGNLETWMNNLQDQFTNLHLEFLTNNLSDLIPSLLSKVQEWAEGLLPGLVTTSMSVVSGVINVFLSIVVSIYILADKGNLEKGLRKFFYAVFKPEKAKKISKTTRECSNIFSNYFTGKIFDSLIVGIICGIMMLILGLPYPLLIAVLVGVTNIIPFFGPFIGAIPSILIELMIGWKEALILTILIIVLQQIDGNIIGPKIIGNSTGLSPISVLFAITIGGWIGGLGGMLFSVPVMAVIAHIVEGIVNNRLEKKGFHTMVERAEPPKTLNYSDMIRRIFKRKKSEEEENPEEPKKKPAAEIAENENETDEGNS